MRMLRSTVCFLMVFMWWAAAAPIKANATAWSSVDVNGVSYLPLENIRSFYKLTPLPRSQRSQARVIVGNKDVSLEFGPGLREVMIGGTQCWLSHPLRDDGKGDFLLSMMDAVKLVDPILRPTYIQGRRSVRTIVIDPGHGGHDAGTQTVWVREADCTQLVATKLRDELARRMPDVNIIITREENQYRSEQQRVDLMSGTDAPIFISLHLNSGRSDMRGVETYTAAPAAPGEQPRPGNVHDASNAALAYALQTALVKGTGAVDGGCRRARYSLLNSVGCPAVMVELGYATHEEEAKQLATVEYQTKLAQAIAEGVCNFARMSHPTTQLEYVEPPKVETPPTPVKAELPTPKVTREKKTTRAKEKTTRAKERSRTRKSTPRRDTSRRGRRR